MCTPDAAEAAPKKKALVVVTDDSILYDSDVVELLDVSKIQQDDLSELSDGDHTGIPAMLREHGYGELADEIEEFIADNTCAEEGCFDDLSDGEGFDGFCGDHADQREEAGVYDD